MLLRKDQNCIKFKVKYSDFCTCDECHFEKRKVDIKPIMDRHVIGTEPPKGYIFDDYEAVQR